MIESENNTRSYKKVQKKVILTKMNPRAKATPSRNSKSSQGKTNIEKKECDKDISN